MKEVKALRGRSYRTLLKVDYNDAPTGFAVFVAHDDLDSLIGRLMQMCDLIGDQEQRKALKDTIKGISREWLDGIYSDSGYEKWTGIAGGVRPVVIQETVFVKLSEDKPVE